MQITNGSVKSLNVLELMNYDKNGSNDIDENHEKSEEPEVDLHSPVHHH